jgi:hypothetical protein
MTSLLMSFPMMLASLFAFLSRYTPKPQIVPPVALRHKTPLIPSPLDLLRPQHSSSSEQSQAGRRHHDGGPSAATSLPSAIISCMLLQSVLRRAARGRGARRLSSFVESADDG